MTGVSLSPEDLPLLRQLAPDLDFSDQERQNALLESGSRDFNAVPGSGKTSLLAAKLLLLATKWPHTRKGICILSHTNVAREEIARRLAQTPEGSKLLGYPHFIGTIHGFINQFMALPALRSWGMSVDVIDDDIFAARAIAKLREGRFSKLRSWLSQRQNGDAIIGKLSFKGAGLKVMSEGGNLPGENSDSSKQALLIKDELAKAGIFRYCDMFAIAEAALAECPSLLDAIHLRFPMVFIDEMQDTSWEQESLLNRHFDGKSTVQRFGDIDQKIITNDSKGGKVTFPRIGHGTITTSKRFGARIADAVASVRPTRLPVSGDAADDIAPVLLLYKTADVGKVVKQFGRLVIERFDAAALRGQTTRGMCARKSGDGAVEVGRHLGDYWPAFANAQSAEAGTGSHDFWRLISNDATRQQMPTLAERASDVRKATLLVLRAAKAPVAEGQRDGRALVRAVAELIGNASSIQRLILDLALKQEPYDTPQARDALAELLHQRLGNLLPASMTLEAFKALDPFIQSATLTVAGESPTSCVVLHSGRELAFTIGTVAGMKGETHLASLLLESYGGNSRKFDLEVALPYIAGVGTDITKLSPTQQLQMRSVYVGISRPTRFLCLAANESRVEAATLEGLKAKGWEIVDVE